VAIAREEGGSEYRACISGGNPQRRMEVWQTGTLRFARNQPHEPPGGAADLRNRDTHGGALRPGEDRRAAGMLSISRRGDEEHINTELWHPPI